MVDEEKALAVPEELREIAAPLAFPPGYPPALVDLAYKARVLVRSGLFSGDDMAKVVTKAMAGDELGLGVFASQTAFDVIKTEKGGTKVEMNADLQARLVKRHPHYDYRVRKDEHTNERCAIDFYQDGEWAGESIFTMDDAKRVGLAGKDVWKKYPANMLWARALTNGVQWHCPDVTDVRIYGIGEISGNDGEWAVIGPPDLDPEPSVEQVRTSTTEQELEEGGDGGAPEQHSAEPPSEGYDEPPVGEEEGAVPDSPAEGSEAAGEPEQATLEPEVKMISHPQMKAIRAIAHGDLGWTDEELHNFARVASTKDLTHAQASDLIDALAIVAREKKEEATA